MDFEFSEVESLDKVPEQFRPLYTEAEGGGKFLPNESFKGVVEAVTGLNRSLKAARQEAKNGKIDLSPLADFGDNPASIKEAIDARIAEIQENAKGEGKDLQKKIDAVKGALTETHSKELAARDARNEALQNQLYSLMVENTATTEVVSAKGDPELLLPFIKNQTKVAEEDGKFKVYVIDSMGEIRYGATGSPMTIKELVAEMKGDKKYGRLFESETPAGGGMPPNGAARPPAPGGRQLSSTEKIAAGLSRGSHRRNR